MTTIEYPQGYGRRDPFPVCEPILETLECPCCKGSGEHAYGAGMDADAVDCSPCNRWGYLVTLPNPKSRRRRE